MQKISHQCRCEYNGESAENRFYRFCAKGGVIACAAAYPTKDSRGAAACEKAVTISTESFMRRPALIDEAAQAISGFLNQAVYSLQEPHAGFLCSTAILFVYKGQFRSILSGNAKLLHFSGGKLTGTYDGGANPLFGKSLKSQFNSAAAEKLAQGTNAFLLYSGYEEFSYDAAALEQALQSAADAGDWLSAIPAEGNKYSSLLAVVIPERESFFKDIFKAK